MSKIDLDVCVEKYISNSITFVQAYNKYVKNTNQKLSLSTFKRRVKEYGLDTSHFHNPKKGRKLYEYEKFIMGMTIKGKRQSSYTTKKYREYCKNNKTYSCACCGINVIPLQLDHIVDFAISKHSKKSEMQWLCPNHHFMKTLKVA